jgi:hypothetical protein
VSAFSCGAEWGVVSGLVSVDSSSVWMGPSGPGAAASSPAGQLGIFFCLFWGGMFGSGVMFAFFLLGGPVVVGLLPLGRPLFLIFCGILILVSSSLVVPKAVKTLIFYDSKYFSMHEYLIELF